MRVSPAALPGLLIVEPKVHADERGYFQESWQTRRYADAGIQGSFVQDNISYSRRGVLRGLHYQWPRAQGKLICALRGCVFDVAVDVRRGSPHYGRWFGLELTEQNHQQLWIPPGFAHGFQVLSEDALVLYKATDYYAPADEVTLAWNDPSLAIPWPILAASLAPRDAAAPRLAQLPPERLPSFPGLL